MKISTIFLILFFYLYSGNLSAEIFYIDIDKIINQTNVGKHINKEFENTKKINDAKNLESKNELQKRILSSIILIPITIFFIFQGPVYFTFFLSIFFLISSYEWIKMNKKDSFKILGIFYFIFKSF